MSVEHKRARNDNDENSKGGKDIKDNSKLQDHKSEEERSGLKNIENKIKKGIDESSKENEKARNASLKSTLADKEKKDTPKYKEDENNKLKEKIKNFKEENKDQKENDKVDANKLDWEQDFKKGSSEVRDSLRKGNKDLSSELEKAYQGILKNCLKQSEDEPHKMEKCWDEFSMKMKPVFKILQEKSAESSENLKKCFESKGNAKECVREGIDFGQKALSDASNSLKEYLA